jgi:hypothetical protein
MIENYLKIAWRNLFKNKTFSLINILGLALGMTSSYSRNFTCLHQFHEFKHGPFSKAMFTAE